MKDFKTPLFIVTLSLFAFALNAQNYNHPKSGSVSYTLTPGVHYYYDDGGSNGFYSNNISGSSIAFEIPAGYRIDYNFEQIDIEMGSFCQEYDYLESFFVPTCSDLGTTKCFSGKSPINLGDQLCHGEFISFTFYSDAIVSRAGWKIRLEVVPKSPAKVICQLEDKCELNPEQIECTPNGNLVLLSEVYCWAFGQCHGVIDQYPGCSTALYPGPEKWIFIDNPGYPVDITIENDCPILDVFLIDFNCNCLAKGQLVDGRYVFKNVIVSGPYIQFLVEIDCVGDIVYCYMGAKCQPAGNGSLDCNNAIPINCSEKLTGNTSTGKSNVSQYPCVIDNGGKGWTGKEVIYKFQPNVSGTADIQLTGNVPDLDLFIFDECDNQAPCSYYSKGSTSNEFIDNMPIEDGHIYYIIIDGYNGTASAYSLEIICNEKNNCINCGNCFTYSISTKNAKAQIKLNSHYVDCSDPGFPSGYTFRWTVDGVNSSTLQNPVLNLDKGKLYLLCEYIKKPGGSEILVCCRNVNIPNICGASPVAHYKIESSSLATGTVTFDPSASQSGTALTWEWGDGSNNTLGGLSKQTHTYTKLPLGVPSYSTCLYAQNEFGISSYCLDLTPTYISPPGPQCPLPATFPKFNYVINNKSISVSGTDVAGITSYNISYGDGISGSGASFSTPLSHTYGSTGVYEICIHFNIEKDIEVFYNGGFYFLKCVYQGCACFTVNLECCSKIEENCTSLKYKFLQNPNGELTYLFENTSGNNTVKDWEVDDVPVQNTANNTFQYKFPAPGKHKVCCYYIDATGCLVKCCRYIDFGNPLNCFDVIKFKPLDSQNGYQFELTDANADNISWYVDETGESLGTGVSSLIYPYPTNCIVRTITVYYYDKINKVWKICCIPIYYCYPYNCTKVKTTSTSSNTVTFDVDKTGLESALLTDPDGQQTSWNASTLPSSYTIGKDGDYTLCCYYKVNQPGGAFYYLYCCHKFKKCQGTAPSTPVISASGGTSLCFGQSVTLTVTNVCSGCTVTWSNGQTGNTLKVSQEGSYYATMSNACATSLQSNEIIITNYKPVFTINQGCYFAGPGGSNYQWLLNGQDIPGATTQFYTATATGYYALKMTNTNGCAGISDIVFANCKTAIAELFPYGKIHLFPNPARNTVNIEIELTKSLELYFELFNSAGQVVGHIPSLDKTGNILKMKVPLDGISSGTYYFQTVVKGEEKAYIQQFEVVR